MKRSQAGFTLLEAVVAMTLLVTVGGALLAWLNSTFIMVERMQATQQRIAVSRLALAYLERLNPATQDNGDAHLGHYRLEWTSQPLTEPRPVVGRYTGHPGPYEATLFLVRARVSEEGHVPVDLSLELPGYRQVRYSQDQGMVQP